MSNQSADDWVATGLSWERGDPNLDPDFDEALDCYNRAIAIDPRHGKARLHRAVMLYRFKKYQQALDDLPYSITGPQSNWLDQECAALCYLALQRYREAFYVSNQLITTFEQNAKKDPKWFKKHPDTYNVSDSRYWLLRARAYAGLRDYKRALADFAHVDTLLGKGFSNHTLGGGDANKNLFYFRGLLYLELGQYREACEALDYVFERYDSKWDIDIDADTLRRKRDEAHRRLGER